MGFSVIHDNWINPGLLFHVGIDFHFKVTYTIKQQENKVRMNMQKAGMINVYTLRVIIGVLAFTLPIILVIGSWVLSDCSGIQDSISTYYHTIMRNYFVGSLSAVSLSLFAYKGFEKKDDITGDFAALVLLIVAFLPTNHNPSSDLSCIIIPVNVNPVIGQIHFIAAAVFFLLLSYFSIVLFTKSTSNPSPQKLIRNKIYRSCGYLMIASIVLIAIFMLLPNGRPLADSFNLIFWLESLALFAFGLSWMIKGEILFKDKVES